MKQITATITGSVLLAVIGFSCSQPSNMTLLERGNYAMWQERWSDATTDFTKANTTTPW